MPVNMNGSEDARDLEAVNARLSQIADEVADDSLSLDEALSLYEEAVSLGMRASELIEADIDPKQGDSALTHENGEAG